MRASILVAGRSGRSAFIWLLLFSLLSARPCLADVLTLTDTVLAQDTVWSGEVLIDGVVVVGKAATLRIEPGTTVRFVPRDRDGDGVGDAQIRVTGGLIAEGEPFRPIRFLSDRTPGRPKDWAYVLIFASPARNLIRYCDFSGAFSGVQVHFSSAVITDSLFRGNHEGVRFGRADLRLLHNEITENQTGIRFTRMEGPLEIRGNRISGNRVGLFLSPSEQNIQDFFEPDRGDKVWATGRMVITGNVIEKNVWYNLSLGDRQLWDVPVSGNWWGTPSPEVIRETIFDRARDSAVGRALIDPVSREPLPGAGIR